jgi:hypothetical protein
MREYYVDRGILEQGSLTALKELHENGDVMLL